MIQPTIISRPLLIVGLLSVCSTGSADETVSFPVGSQWETVTPQQANVDEERLNIAMEFAMSRKSSSVVVVHSGRILAERHATVKDPSRRYTGLVHGRNSAGHVIEDVASVQKSITSVLLGIALEKQLLTLNDSVSHHLGEGWSSADPAQEKTITLRHLITMTSGLNEQLKFVADPETKWQYNTSAYAQSLLVVCKAAGMSANELTQQWLTGPLQMTDSKWVERRLLRQDSTIAANKYGFTTTARDLAKFGLMILNDGRFAEHRITSDNRYLKTMVTPSQQLNPSYGFLWWLNGEEFVLRGNRKIRSSLFPTAPQDMFAAQGALGRRCYVVPSANLVVTRLGDDPNVEAKDKFDNRFWQLLRDAATK